MAEVFPRHAPAGWGTSRLHREHRFLFRKVVPDAKAGESGSPACASDDAALVNRNDGHYSPAGGGAGASLALSAAAFVLRPATDQIGLVEQQSRQARDIY